MALQTKTITYGGHTISLNYDDAKPWTKDDASLENAYFDLVKNKVELHEMVYQSIMQLAPISSEIGTLREFLMLIKDFSIEAREEADNLMLSFMSPHEDDYDRDILNEKVVLTEKAFGDYHVKITELEPKITLVSNLVNKYTSMIEDSLKWKVLSKIETKHFRKYKTNAIDTNSYSEEKERFQTFLSVTKEHSDSINRMHDGYVSDYNILMLQTEMEYGIWNEFVKRLDLLTKMVKVKVPSMISDEPNLN